MNNILHINSNYADKFYLELFSSIKSRGYNNIVFVPQKIGYDDCPDATGVVKSACYSKFDRFFLNRKTDKIINSILDNVDIKNIDLIHAHSLYTTGVPAYRLWEKYHIPYVVSVRYNDISDFPKIHPFSRCLINKVLRNAKAVVFITPLIEKKTRRLFRALKEENVKNKCHVIPNKVSSFFLEENDSKKEHNEHLKILFVGRPVKIKRLNLLAERCKKYFKDGDKLQIISGSSEKPVKLLNKYPFIEYIGKVNHQALSSYYRNADIFALLSRKETFGISYIESISQGTPILYAKNQAIDGLFEDGQVGYSVKAHCSKDFKKKLDLILSNYEQISKQCIEASKDFSDDVIVDKLVELYK